MGKSIKHREKLKKLVESTDTGVTVIGPVRVCFDDEFIIGNGCGGTAVYVGLHEDGSEVAVKRMLINHREQFIKNKEKEILSLLHVKVSEHIVNYRHFEYEKPFSYLILDLCEETLEDYVKAHDEEFLKEHGPVIIREILTGLRALHGGEEKILHLDLKPQNILMDIDGHMRLADFGISRILNKDQTTIVTGQIGTRGWIAVESLHKSAGSKTKFKRKSDIQVAGMISFYVLTKGQHPFGEIYHQVSNIIDGKPVYLDKLSDPLARDFVASMISHKIEDRPYVEQALDHPYLQIKPGNQFGNKSMDGSFASPAGFMANTNFDSRSMSEGKQKTRKNLSMVPVTVALIQNTTYNSVEDVCELDGIRLHQVTFVGLICEVQENTTHLAYEIYDLTGGRITVKKWIDKEDNMEEFNQSQFREDTYVRVYGYIKTQDADKKTIVAFSINRVVDFNEITYHLLSVVHARLKMKETASADNSADNSAISAGTGGQNMQFGGSSFSGGQRGFGDQSMENSGMSKTHSRVLEIISSTHSTEGMGMDEIRQ